MSDPTVATKQLIEQVFDGAAERYDREGPNVFTQFGNDLVDLLNLKGSERILDVATGKGAVLIPCAERIGRYGRVVGIDLSQKMLEETEQTATAASLKNFELYKMDAEHLEFRDGIFDIVTCAFSLFFFSAMDAALHEMWRVLQPGGRLALALFAGTPPPFDPGWRIFGEQARAYSVAVRTPQRVVYSADDVRLMLTDAGFDQIKIEIQPYEIVFDDLEKWWAFQFTLGNRATLLRMDDATRAKFKAEYFAQLQPLLKDDGLHLGVSVLYAIANKLTADR